MKGVLSADIASPPSGSICLWMMYCLQSKEHTKQNMTVSKGTHMHSELWFCPQVKNFCAKVLNLRAQSTATAIYPGSAFYDHLQGGEAPSDVIVVYRSRIHDQMAVSVAVAVDCHQVNNFCTKVLNLRAKPKFFMHIRHCTAVRIISHSFSNP